MKMKDLVAYIIVALIIIGASLFSKFIQKPTEIRIHIDSSFCDTREVEE